jgi:hypothetical protein
MQGEGGLAAPVHLALPRVFAFADRRCASGDYISLLYVLTIPLYDINTLHQNGACFSGLTDLSE